jgi:uncharacterized protein YhaN
MTDIEQPRQRRRWPWAVAVAALVVVVAGLSWYSYDARQAADEWQRATDEWEERAEQRRVQLEAEQQRADQLTEALEASEADVALLEQRVTDLAAEKAAVADERELAESARDVYADLSVLATDAAGQLSACVAAQDRLFQAILATAPDLDRERVGSLAADADRVCTSAYAAVDQLERAIAAAGS